MKLFFITFLSFVLLLPTFGNVVIYFSFKVNQDEISKTICIQRANINNSCNGRCDLQKSLKKFEDNEKKMENHLKEKVELVYVQYTHTIVIDFIRPTVSKSKYFFNTNQKPIAVSLSNFRPPSFFI